MKLKLDENLSRHLKPVLMELQHDVATAAEQDLLSLPDTEVARAAFNEGRMLLTLDIEFADLRKYPPGSHPGIILFRPHSLSPLSVNKFIADFVKSADINRLAGCIAVVDRVHVRVRSPENEP